MHKDNLDVYGVEKVWKQLRRERTEVGRDRVARLMAELELMGAVRGKTWRTTIPGQVERRPADLVERNFTARYTERLADEQAVVSVGSRGDSYDNALAESVIGLFKTEVVKRQGSWRSFEQLELATARWVDWYNNRRLHSSIGDVPPAEFEATYYAKSTTVDAA